MSKGTVLNKLLSKSYELKTQLDTIKKNLDEINDAIINLAQFKEGAKTTHLDSEGYSATVVKRIKTVWDQDKLFEAAEHMTPEEFGVLFRVNAEPVSKIALDAYLKSNESLVASYIMGAKLEKEMRHHVTVIKREPAVKDVI